MTKLLLVILAIASFQVKAETIQLLSKKLRRDYSYETPVYKTNPTLGRAWFEITEVDDTDNEDSYYNDIRVKVPGMSYDTMTEEIVIERSGKKTVCATTELRRRVLGQVRYIRPTGDCTFSQEVKNVIVDDGYYQRRVKKINIYLHIN